MARTSSLPGISALRSEMEWPGRLGLAQRMEQWIGRRSLACSGARCLDSWGRIAQALGHPSSILCLGNGPSSEDAAVAAHAEACLFRVNWIWHDRAQLTRPRVIFTADPELPPSGSDGLIGFPTRSDANRILGLYRRGGALPRGGYFVMSELPSPLLARPWPLRPTNGAMMIAAAAQLHPARLVIAGIDLYQHPAGKYPGATAEANDYDAIHSRENDLAAIALALAQYGGEIVVIGEALRAAIAGLSPSIRLA